MFCMMSDTWQQQFKMIVRELVEFLVFPKYFNVINFYAKGQYAFRIALSIQDDDHNIIKALPVLIETPQAKKEHNKKAKIETSPENSYFQSEHFFVTYNQEKIILNAGCRFCIEYECTKKYKTCLSFQLIYISTKSRKNVESAVKNNLEPAAKEPEKKVKIVDHRKIYLNCYNELNTYKRIIFEDCDYFSYCDVCLISQSFGEKIRLKKYQAQEFNSMSHELKQKQHLEKEKLEFTSHEEKVDKFRDIFEEPLQTFYEGMISKKVKRYKEVCLIFQNLKLVMMFMNNSGMASELTKLDYLEWLHEPYLLTEQEILDQFETETVKEAFFRIYEQSRLILHNTTFIWQSLIQLLLSINFNIFESLANRSISNEQIAKRSWLTTYEEIKHEERQNKRRHFLTKRTQILSKLDVYEDHDVFHPFLIVENFDQQENQKQRPVNSGLDIESLVIFVHGYQGSDIDLEKARNFMSLYNPYCYGLMIKSIQDDMEETIEHLGKLLADQIKMHIMNSLNTYKRINFVGYSLGGVVARESMKHLTKFQAQMNIFVSFASPHAGVKDSDNFLVKTGIWFLTNFDKVKNLKQLNCEPNQNEQVTLMKLSECDCLSWFKRFVVVSSREDDFVPYNSSRIDEENVSDMAKQICLNIKKRIKRLERIEVWFDVEHDIGKMDKLLGRRAHIQFLENRIFLDSFFSIYASLL